MAPRRRTVLLALVLGSAVAVLPHVPASAAPAQDPGTEVIVGGQVGTESSTTSTAPPTTTTAAPTTTTAADANEPDTAEPTSTSTRLMTESRKVMAVIGGLVFVALALLLLTIRYWKATKPVAPATADGALAATGTAQALASAEAAEAAEATETAETAEQPEEVEAAETAATVEPDTTADADPPKGRKARKAAKAAAAAAAVTADRDAQTDPVAAPAPAPVVARRPQTADEEVAALVGAFRIGAKDSTPSGAVPSVQATAPGTDHASADDDWQPRTGEHERVEIPPKPSTARPSRAARRQALGLTPDA